MLLHKYKSEYFNQKLENAKGNTAATWKTVRQLIPATTNKVSPLLTGNGESLEQKANKFNNFFANIGKQTFENSQHNLSDRERTDQPSTNHAYTSTGGMFRPQPTDDNTIILVIKHLKTLPQTDPMAFHSVS